MIPLAVAGLRCHVWNAGSSFLYVCVHVSCSVMFTLHDTMDCSLPVSSVHAILQAGQNTGVGSLSLLQGIFPAQGLNPGLLHYRQILYHQSHQGNPQKHIGSWKNSCCWWRIRKSAPKGSSLQTVNDLTSTGSAVPPSNIAESLNNIKHG